MKKIILFMLSLLFCSCILFTVSAGGEEEYVCGDFTYTVLRDGTAKITGYDRSKIDLIVPDELDGHQVTVIGHSAFNCGEIATIQLPATLKTIEELAFSYTDFLSEIVIPEGVTTIETGAFGVSNLERITLPSTLKVIERYVFTECSHLREIIIPEGVKSIESGAFTNNWRLKE